MPACMRVYVCQFTRFSPLMAAAKNNNIDTLKLLLKAGADPFITELVRDATR